jgi:hypothetical protein
MMDWKLLLIGAVMTVVGGFIMLRFRKSDFRHATGPGCLMAVGILLAGTGVLAIVFAFVMQI